jgi:hypothetical protein
MVIKRSLRSILLLLSLSSPCWATYQNTGFTTINIWADNGVTYFSASGATIGGNCQYNRLELRETGDYYGNPENGRRMYAMILAAQLEGKLINLGYNDTDGPACRIVNVQVQW